MHIFTKYSWAVPWVNKSGISKSNGFKTILLEHRIPENLCVDRGSEFIAKNLNVYLKNIKRTYTQDIVI